jgi:hypothetical protein
MTSEELKTLVQSSLRQLQNYLESEDYDTAITMAEKETGWTLPVTTSFREYWMIRRAKRHIYDILLAGSAHKFKLEQINLQHRFEHYKSLVRDEDKAFKDAIKENPAEFAGVDSFKLFGTKIDAGFSSDFLGRDTTYSEDNVVVFTPKETD